MIATVPAANWPVLRLSLLCGQAAYRASNVPGALKTSINAYGFVADTTQEAADIFYGLQAEVMSSIGRERG
jgi:hypothetical protein